MSTGVPGVPQRRYDGDYSAPSNPRPARDSYGPAEMKHGPRLFTNDAEAQDAISRAVAKRARKAAKRLGVPHD